MSAPSRKSSSVRVPALSASCCRAVPVPPAAQSGVSRRGLIKSLANWRKTGSLVLVVESKPKQKPQQKTPMLLSNSCLLQLATRDFTCTFSCDANFFLKWSKPIAQFLVHTKPLGCWKLDASPLSYSGKFLKICVYPNESTGVEMGPKDAGLMCVQL